MKAFPPPDHQDSGWPWAKRPSPPVKISGVNEGGSDYTSTEVRQGNGTGETLDKSQFRKGGKPKDENDNFGYKKGNGILWYDGNGSDAGGHLDVIKLDKGLDITHLNIGP